MVAPVPPTVWHRLDVERIPRDVETSPFLSDRPTASAVVPWLRAEVWRVLAEARPGDGVTVGIGREVAPLAGHLADLVTEARARGVTVRIVALSEVSAA